jgi:hypothetical protein
MAFTISKDVFERSFFFDFFFFFKKLSKIAPNALYSIIVSLCATPVNKGIILFTGVFALLN